MTEEEEFMDFFGDKMTLEGELTDKEVAQIIWHNFSSPNKANKDKVLPCLFPNCNSIGVEKSHLFAQTFLEIITEDGKLYTKGFYPNIDELYLFSIIESIGVKECLTFPGFCKKCEQKFTFEKFGHFSSEVDYRLQLMRYVCYSIRVLESLMRTDRKDLKSIRAASAKKIEKAFITRNVKVGSVKWANYMEYVIDDRMKKRKKVIQKNRTVLNAMTEAITGHRSIKLYRFRVPELIPLFLGFYGHFEFDNGSLKFGGNLVINIHPISKTATDFIIVDLNNGDNLEGFSDITDLILYRELIPELLKASNDWAVSKSFWDKRIAQELKDSVFEKTLLDKNKVQGFGQRSSNKSK